MSKKIYVFDTSVCLADARSLTKFENNDIVIPFKVLEEIDGHKKRQDAVGANAREVIRFLDGLRKEKALTDGVKIGDGLGTLKVVHPKLLKDVTLDTVVPDNEIIETACFVKKLNPKRKVTLITRDINMRVKCDSLNVPCEDYRHEHVIDSSEKLFTGFRKIVVEDKLIEDVYDSGDVFYSPTEKIYPNEFLLLTSDQDEKKSVLVRFTSKDKPLIRVNEKEIVYGKIKPKNKEQVLAINLLLDRSAKVVTLVGRSGGGKTLIALAAALQLQEKFPDEYRKILVCRPIVTVGNDLGFLPGSMEEKLSPWTAPIYDNLEFLLDVGKKSGNNKKTLDYYFEDGIIEVEAMAYIRGRSISNAIIIIDESQNLNKHEIKTILTRVGEGTKIILTGDIEQIDSPYLDETNNGLSHLVEKFKDFKFSGHVTLKKGERSEVATAASQVL